MDRFTQKLVAKISSLCNSSKYIRLVYRYYFQSSCLKYVEAGGCKKGYFVLVYNLYLLNFSGKNIVSNTQSWYG